MNGKRDDPRQWIELSPIWPRIEASAVLRNLRDYDATIAGSWPIGLALTNADVDVICHAPLLDAFARDCRAQFSQLPNYGEAAADSEPPAHLCRFCDQGLRFEIFGQDRPIGRQNAYRHMLVEAGLLRLGGARLRQAVRARKRLGLNTEAAFADALGIDGDPFDALLQLEGFSDEKLLYVLNIHSDFSTSDSS